MGRRKTNVAKDEYKMVNCTGCGTKLREAHAAILHPSRPDGSILCSNCVSKDEEPPQVQLVYSNWAPWGEQPIVPIGDLLTSETRGRFMEKRVHAKPA